jgi:prepilin-type N-terminal cleavage/methylation domain-containing protein
MISMVEVVMEHSPQYARTSRMGFTLIEIMLVVVILGIVSALVIAGVGDASIQSRLSTLRSSLYQMRTQINWYGAQHRGGYPSGAALFDQLTKQTDVNGSFGAGANLGPYLSGLPANPYNGLKTVKEIASGSPMVADGSTGWIYQVEGENFVFKANNVGTSPDGVSFDTY